MALELIDDSKKSADLKSPEAPSNSDGFPLSRNVENLTSTTSTPTTIKSSLPKKEIEIINGILHYLTNYRDENGHDVSKDFQRLVNRRILPDYFDVIKEPMAFSTIRAKILRKQYQNFKSFVRDFALITYNAQVYNRPSALVYADSLALRELFVAELQKLVVAGSISAEDAEIPYLGQIPEYEDSPPPDLNDKYSDEEDDDDDDDSDDDRGRRGRKKRRRSSTALRGNRTDEGGKEDQEYQKKRGRPPKVLTPMEARITTLLKGLRKLRNPNGDLKILPFEKLPDKFLMPEYYQEIKQPISMDLIKKKAKRKKYTSIDQVLKDLDLMFENAKSYNLEGSQVYKDAVDLQREARIMTEQEKRKPDSVFFDEDGRLPVPEILHNNEMWKVGDWIHLSNPNDFTKPIIAQIYRTWQDPQGQKWINACWYYRPEQTVHNFEKHFYVNEVVKTGQYRDHKIEEVIDRCFVMFFTRYNKGRPRGLPPDKEVYVCEARYNEERFKLNKIKTWASCVPDEVREKDYEMDLFNLPKKMKKIPSPIKHLLPENAKEDDPLPKPTWGVSNAPPIVGAVHRIPRGPNESPPPETTLSPILSESVRNAFTADRPRLDPQSDVSALGYGTTTSVLLTSSNQSTTQVHSPLPSAPNRQALSSTPVSQSTPYVSHMSASHVAPQQTPAFQSQGNYNQYSAANPPVPQLTKSVSKHNLSSNIGHNPISISTPMQNSHSNVYNPPRPIEIYTLPETTNSSIPLDIRDQFHQDESGKVIFFTTPPININPVSNEVQLLGHSLKYLADKVRCKEEDEKKRKARELELEKEEMERVQRLKVDAQRKKDLITAQCVNMIMKWSSDLEREASNLYEHLDNC